MDLGLAGKAFVITGSTRGIGFASALALAREGARIGICGRDPTQLAKAVAELRAISAHSHGEVVDLLSASGVEDFIANSARIFGRLDGAVASLGGTQGGDFKNATAADWLATYAMNTGHAMRTVSSALPHMEACGGGSIVIIGSIAGSRPGPRAQYGASKAAEISMAAGLARELAPSRVRVNTVSPGSILFEGGSWAARAAAHPERIAEFLAQQFPWGRMGTLEEVASVVAFIMSPRASWVTGANIIVDGAQGVPSIRL